jgi:hypothetical protein
MIVALDGNRHTCGLRVGHHQLHIYTITYILSMESHRHQHIFIENVLTKLHPALEETAMTAMATMDRVSPRNNAQSPEWQHPKSPRNHPAEELATSAHSGAPMRRQDSQRCNALAKPWLRWNPRALWPQGHPGYQAHGLHLRWRQPGPEPHCRERAVRTLPCHGATRCQYPVHTGLGPLCLVLQEVSVCTAGVSGTVTAHA